MHRGGVQQLETTWNCGQVYDIDCSRGFSLSVADVQTVTTRSDNYQYVNNGEFRLAYGGHSTSIINFDASPETMKAALEGRPGIGEVKVNACAAKPRFTTEVPDGSFVDRARHSRALPLRCWTDHSPPNDDHVRNEYCSKIFKLTVPAPLPCVRPFVCTKVTRSPMTPKGRDAISYSLAETRHGDYGFTWTVTFLTEKGNQP